MLSILTMLITQLSKKLLPLKLPNSNITCSSLWATTNYKQSNRTYGKDLSHSQTSRNMQESRAESSFSRFTRQYRWGRSRAGCCMSVCTDLSQTLHRTACSWLASREGVSNATTRGTASTESSYTLRARGAQHRHTGYTRTWSTTLNQLCYNRDTQCPEGTPTWRDTVVKQKCSSISGPGQLLPARTGKPKSCQQLWKPAWGRSVLCHLNSACKQLAFKSQKMTNPKSKGSSNWSNCQQPAQPHNFFIWIMRRNKNVNSFHTAVVLETAL